MGISLKYIHFRNFLDAIFFIASMKWHHCSKYSQVTCSIVASSDPASSHPLHCCFSQNSGHGVACLAGCPGCPHKAQESDWNIEKDILVIQKNISTPLHFVFRVARLFLLSLHSSQLSCKVRPKFSMLKKLEQITRTKRKRRSTRPHFAVRRQNHSLALSIGSLYQ